MEPQQPDTNTTTTWLIIASVFVAAILVTVFLGTRANTSSETTYADLGSIAETDPNLPDANDAAPTFALETFNGDTFDLAEHIADDGRPVVLNLWASWCPPCRAEMPAIDRASLIHPEVAFVGVAVKDSEDGARAFVEEIGITYTIALDDGSVDDAYPVLGLPATFFIDGNGTLVKTIVGSVTANSLDDDIAELFGI